jgi:hypothetical protein
LLVTRRAYPREHLKGAPIGLALALAQILRSDRKGFPRTNTLAYQELSSEMKEKSFITLTPGVNLTKPFSFLGAEIS